MATWQSKVTAVFGGPNGYDNATMRRSLQAIVLYEAKRCASRAMATMKPFQRKVAFLDQCRALIESLDLLYPHQRAELLWRTATSKEQMDGEIAWKRAKSVEKELEGLAIKIKPFMAAAKSHQEAVDLLVQNMYETLTGFKGKTFPDNWEHAHNQNITCFRLYYEYDVLDSTFPDAVSPRDLVIPTVRPEKVTTTTSSSSTSAPASLLHASSASTVTAKTTSMTYAPAKSAPLPLLSPLERPPPAHTSNNVEMAALLGGDAAMGGTTTGLPTATAGTGFVLPSRGGVEERRRLMQEVRIHLDLLKDFEGAVPESEINQRKRELFAILPSLSGSLAALTAAESSLSSSSSTTTVNPHASSSAVFGSSRPPAPAAKKAKSDRFP